ncbi:hypothetical protein ONZ45_g675 [Pleurotus djamor]|nr:hypothetical protein ONZ45_g675 [Pleurotus djamor]
MARTKPSTNDVAKASPTTTSENLPPPRTKKPLKSVSPPLASARLNRLIYALVLTTALLGAYYSYRIVQYKTQVGGWWNFAVGRRPPQFQPNGGANTPAEGSEGARARGKSKETTVEERINALAEALGMPSKELASAIAIAVKEYVPPASLSSVAAKETGPAVEAMLKADSNPHNPPASNTQEGDGAGVVRGVFSGVESFVGLDEP